MPGIPQGPPFMLGHLITSWNVIVVALALLAVAGALWIRHSRNGSRGAGDRTSRRRPRPVSRGTLRSGRATRARGAPSTTPSW